MHSYSLVASLLSVAAFARAQGSHAPAGGRFLCNAVGGGPDPTQCDIAFLQANNPAPDGGFTTITPDAGDDKASAYLPTNSECVLDSQGSGNYYCGWDGASCNPTLDGTATPGCDAGVCMAQAGSTTLGNCRGLPGFDCNGNDALCLGYLYCTNGDGDHAMMCGGLAALATDPTTYPGNAYCAEEALFGSDFDQNQANFDTLCVAGAFCDQTTDGNCRGYSALGEACPDGTAYGCTAGNTCSNGVCIASPVASGAARTRRNKMHKRSGLCPASHTACSITDSKKGFECIDTQSNLEQCGACASAGGVDCTALPGVDAVGCVAGQCEIWACAEGYAFDASTSSCTVALVV